MATAKGMFTDSDMEIIECDGRGWGSSGSDVDSDGSLPLLPVLAAQGEVRPRRDPPPSDHFRVWLENIAYQVGNAAHEIRNALRFWASLVTEDASDKNAKLTQKFKKADKTSGQLEATMRNLVGKIRNVQNVNNPLARLLPKAQNLLESVKDNLVALSDDARGVVREQQKAIHGLISRQEAYLAAIMHAHISGNRLPIEAEAFRFWLPPPGKRVDFGVWGATEESFINAMLESLSTKQQIKPDEIIGLARLACNTSHQLQNLAVAPRGGMGSDARGLLNKLDNIAGQCENRSRKIMIFAHRMHRMQAEKPRPKIVQRAAFLKVAVTDMREIVASAMHADGGSTVPAENLSTSLDRLELLTSILHDSGIPSTTGPPKACAGSPLGYPHDVPGVALPLQMCAGCNFVVTGLAAKHCCKRCEKGFGTHGPRCKQLLGRW